MAWKDLSNLVSEIYENFHDEPDPTKKSAIKE
jgi:hypothetical protein